MPPRSMPPRSLYRPGFGGTLALAAEHPPSGTSRMKTAAALCSALFVCAALPASAQDDVAAFYKGKQLRMIVGSAVGGGYDLFARIVARHIVHYIPGHPSIIVQNQPSAGGVVMTNQLYGQGPKDGTVIGVPINGLPTAPLLQSGHPVRRDQAHLDRQHQSRGLCRVRVAHGAGREHRRADPQGSGGGRHHARHHDGRFPAPGERRARHEVQDRARVSGNAADQSRHRARRGAGHGRARLGVGQGADPALDRREEDQGARPVRLQAPCGAARRSDHARAREVRARSRRR